MTPAMGDDPYLVSSHMSDWHYGLIISNTIDIHFIHIASEHVSTLNCLCGGCVRSSVTGMMRSVKRAGCVGSCYRGVN